MNMFDIAGKRAIVTGASRGLGFAMAQALKEAGASLAIISSSDRGTPQPENWAHMR